MITEKLYYLNPYMREAAAKVLEINDKAVILDKTVFYPEGGGQVGDRGWLNNIPVTDTQKDGDTIIHVLEKKPDFKVGDTVQAKLDWQRRLKIMKLHAASHFVYWKFLEIFGNVTSIGSHVDENKSRVDFEYSERIDPEKLLKAETEVNELLRKNIEIKTWTDTKDGKYRHFKAMEHEMGCGGTHPKSTLEIGQIRLRRQNIGQGKERIEIYLVEEKMPDKKEEKKDTPMDLFWADQLAKKIIERKIFRYSNKEIPKFKQYTVKTSASLSGVLHIGRLSDTIRGATVYLALKDAGVKAKLIWVAEDMDPLRKVPANVPADYEKYIGMPVTDIPDPNGCHNSYAEHHMEEYFKVIDEFVYGSMSKFSMRKEYKKGSFRQYIKKILKHIDLVREIQDKGRKEPSPAGWSPWKPVCENCGKIATPKLIDFKDGIVAYKCEDYEFEKTKAKGCGHQGENDPLKGNGKLVWKSEWAAQWARWKVSAEGAGKEYQVPNSAFWINAEITEKVLGFPAPEPIFYEHLLIDDVKMSASLGNVVYPKDWLEVATPELLRFFYNKRLMKTRSFSWKDLPVLNDDYDTYGQVYYGQKQVDNPKEEQHMKRLYKISHGKKTFKPTAMSFSQATVLAQIFPDIKGIIQSLKKTQQLDDKKLIVQRIGFAKSWLHKYAPDEFRIEVQKEVPKNIQLTDSQRKALHLAAESLMSKEWGQEELFNEFYTICKEKAGISPGEFFKAAYMVLLNRERGPKLAPFVLMIGKEKVAKLFASA